jgi:hypothetical protein
VGLQVPIDRGLMKADLRRAPSIQPKISLHALEFLGRIRMQLLFRGSSFVRYLVLLGEPGTQIDQPAPIAAKWPVLRSR